MSSCKIAIFSLDQDLRLLMEYILISYCLVKSKAKIVCTLLMHFVLKLYGVMNV